jgi:hypothetical protein
MVDKAEKVVASQDVVACSVENNAVLLNLADGTYHELNPVAARIWELSKNPRTAQEITTVLLEEYAVEPEPCRNDVCEMLDAMLVKGLLQVHD